MCSIIQIRRNGALITMVYNNDAGIYTVIKKTANAIVIEKTDNEIIATRIFERWIKR